MLQTLRAAGFLSFVGLLGLVLNRTIRGRVCGLVWELDFLLHEKARVEGLGTSVGGVGCSFDSFTNLRLTTARSLPSSQIGWSQIALSPGLHHFIYKWSLLVLPPMGFSLVAALL